MKLIKELQTCTGVARLMPHEYKLEKRVANTVNMTEVYPNTICFPTIELLKREILKEWYLK